MVKYFSVLATALFFFTQTFSQTVTSRPKLVVGMVVDQMRWDYLYRYSEKYTANGFKRILNEGYANEQTYISHFPSYTAPGHTGIYSGSVPAIHGITGNDWFDRDENRIVYCTNDTTVSSVGGSKKAGQQSPHRLLTTTICDELRLATNFRSKTVGIAIKDRGGILTAGHTANAAYWYDGSNGNWITSSYYMNDLPKWVKNFNDKKLVDAYVKKNWNTLMEMSKYWESTEDNMWYEATLSNEDLPVFGHKLTDLKTSGTEIIKSTPFGNTLTFEFAKAAVVGDTLGNRGITDFLAVSFSSTDYIGHTFGPNSIEMEDAYIRMDKELSDFLTFLDEKVGKGNYLFFMSADHGAAHAVGFNKDNHIPAGNQFDKQLFSKVDSFLQLMYSRKNMIHAVINQQVVLNYETIHTSKIEPEDVASLLVEFLQEEKGIARAIDMKELNETTLPEWYKTCLNNQYHPRRTGDVQMLFDPAWMSDFPKGTTHGSIHPYDTHIPLIWFGWGVKQGKDYSRTYMTDIAPTIAALLKIQEPNGCVGKVVTGLLK